MSALRPCPARSGRCPTPSSGRLRPLGVFLGLLFSLFVLVLVSAGGPPARALAVAVSTYQVTTLADGGAGSLREAINSANLNAGSIIGFKPGLSGAILLASALPALAASMTITGPGAAVLAVDGQHAVRPFSVAYGMVRLSGLTIQNGNAGSGGGGGIFNDINGTLTLTACTLTGNTAVQGGGLENVGKLTLTGCTLAGNTVSDHFPYRGVGGGLENVGKLTLTGCTLTGNSATYTGGGVDNEGGHATLALTGCTLTGNSAGLYGGAISNNVPNNAPATLTDSILYGDSAPNVSEVDSSVSASYCDIAGADPLFVTPFVSNAASFDLHLKTGSPCVHVGSALPSGTTDRDGNPYASPAPSLGAYEYGLYTVTNTSDGGAGSLRAAITSANGSAGTVITFKPGLSGTILLRSALPALTASMTITGPGASVLAVDGGGAYQPFSVNSGVTALSGLTIQNGNAGSGGGGGLKNYDTLTLTGCTLTGNSAGFGGGLENVGKLTLIGCTLSGNSAAYGGGVLNAGTLTLTGCTLTGNSASVSGGGAYSGNGTLTLIDDILYGDKAPAGSEIFGAVTASHCDIQQAGYAGGNGNFNADPRLSALGNYGGSARTFALLPGSPCLGAGVAVSGITADARGVAIPQNGRYDIGAFESQGFTVTVTGGGGQSATTGRAFARSLTATVTANDPAHLEPVAGGLVVFTAPTGGASAVLSGSPASIGGGGAVSASATANGVAGSYSVLADIGVGSAGFALSNTAPIIYQVTTLADGGAGSLREAINSANLNAGSIIGFKPGLSGTILLASGLPELTADVTITGPGAAVLAVDGQHYAQPFRVGRQVTASLSGLTIQNGNAGSFGAGGGIASGGTLTLTGCTLAGNSALSNFRQDGGEGGGVWNGGGTLTLIGCTLAGNSAGVGGGVFNGFKGTLTGCTLTGNSAKYSGGGVENDGATLTLTDDILYGDTALNGGEVDGLGTVTANHCDIQQGGYAGSGGNLNADPRLASLGSYGGPARTFALLPGSPCLGAGVAVSGITADARGVAIPQNGRYDIGAFESQGFTVTVTGGGGQSATTGRAFARSLTATVTANDPAHLEPVAGGVVVFTAPAGGASAALSGSPVSIGGGGAASASATANGVAGSYSVLADTGAGSASYGLSNTAAAKAATSVALTSSLNPSLSGQAVTLKATVSGGFSPGGTVTFTIDGTAGRRVALGGGAATYAASGLSVGAHAVTAAYHGDANNAASTSGVLTQTVGAVAVDVSGSVTITQGSYGRVPRTTTIVQQVTLTNTGGTAITGPLSLVLDGLTAGVTLANAAGATTGASGGAAGSPYLNIAGDLAPGASVSVSVRYADPKLALIQYAARVLAGPGSR